MGPRDVLLWPVHAVAGWIDDNPLSAAGILVAVGALAGLAPLVGVGVEAVEGSLVYDSVALTLVAETARTRPAYLVTALVGFVVFLFYDG